jgi:hypothetical protein
VSGVGKVPAHRGDDGARAAHWPGCEGCESDVRECPCGALYAVPLCHLRPDGRAKWGRDLCASCVEAMRRQPARVTVRHGDECACRFCVEADRSEQRSKYTGGQDE